MRISLFVVILALLPLAVFGLVKQVCWQQRTALVLSCPSPKTILLHSVEVQKDPYCQSPPDERKWTREDPNYLWIYCNLNRYGRCRRSISKGTFVRVNYACVNMATLRTFDMCSNSQKLERTPLYMHSPGYLGSGLFYYNWATNCTCRLSPVGLPKDSVYTFTLSVHDSLAASPDGPSLRWGKRRENHIEDVGEYTKVTLTNISSDVFIYFEPESSDSAWFWMHIDSTSGVTFSVACNGALGYPIPPLATVKMTSTTPTTTTTPSPPTTTTTEATTTTVAKTTTAATPTSLSSSFDPLPTSKLPDWGQGSNGANQGSRPEGSSGGGSNEELKNILIGTTTVPWVIILVIVVVVVVIVVRRVRKRDALTNNPPIQHIQLGQPAPQMGQPAFQMGQPAFQMCQQPAQMVQQPAQMNGGVQARPISELNVYAELDNNNSGDVGGISNPIYQGLQKH